MNTRTITHERPGETLEVTVSEATSLMGMKRTVLISTAIGNIRADLGLGEDDKLPDDVEITASFFLRRYTYPTCLAALLSAQGLALDIPFEEFAGLPDVFVAQWESAVFELNPHWQLLTEPEKKAEEKKKQPSANE